MIKVSTHVFSQISNVMVHHVRYVKPVVLYIVYHKSKKILIHFHTYNFKMRVYEI